MEPIQWEDLTELLIGFFITFFTFSFSNFPRGDFPGELFGVLFSSCFDFQGIITKEGGISGVIEKPIRD